MIKKNARDCKCIGGMTIHLMSFLVYAVATALLSTGFGGVFFSGVIGLFASRMPEGVDADLAFAAVWIGAGAILLSVHWAFARIVEYRCDELGHGIEDDDGR